MANDSEIYHKLIKGSQNTKPITVEVDTGEELEFMMRPLTRSQRFDFLSKMPEGMFQEEDDNFDEDTIRPEDVPSGDAVKEMEKVIITSLKSESLGQKQIARLVKNNFEDELVFELSSRIIDYSMDISGVTGFREEQ